MNRRLPRWLVVTACAVALTGTAQAQTARSGGSASAQVMQQLQQLASERTTLQAENEKLKSELAEVKKDRDALKAGQQALDRRARDASAALAHTNSQREAADQELTQSKAKMQELIGKFRETIQKMRDQEGEAAATRQTLANSEHQLTVCTEHNQALYQMNGEILTRLEKQGVFTRVAQAEPFTRVKRIQLENYADEARTHAQDLRVTPATPPPAGSPPAPAATSTAAAPAATPPPSSDHPAAR